MIVALICTVKSDLHAYLTGEKDVASPLSNEEPSTDDSCT